MRLLILSTLCLLAGLVTAQEPLAPPTELLRNAGFDDDADGDGLPDHWSTSERQVRWREKAYLSRDFEIVSQPGQYVLATQELRLQPGVTYTLTLRCRGEGGALAGALILHGEQRPTREMSLLWNLDPPTEYAEYARTFVAPNPVARLYLYNVAKTKGTIAYDRVSLHEGGPDRLIVTPLSFPPIDRPLSAPPETPHLDWATPLAGDPLKTCVILRSLRCLRQVIELGQRVDLDYDVVDTGVEGTACVSETGHRVTSRIGASFYEVYLVSSRVQGILATTLRQRVEAGAGLVLIEGFGRAADLGLADGWTEADAEHDLRQGIPWDLLPEKILSSVQTRTLGEGRVVRLVFPAAVARVWGVLPAEAPLQAYRARQFEYWEWWHSLLGRCLVWAAGRPLPAKLRPVRADAHQIVLGIEGAPPSARASVVLRSGRELRFDGPLWRTGPATVVPDAHGELPITIPAAMPGGVVIADVRLLSAEGTLLTWGSFHTEVPQAVRLETLTPDATVHQPGERVDLMLEVASVAAVPADVEASLIDAWGRVVSRTMTRTALVAGSQQIHVALPLRQPLTVHHKAVVRVRVNGREQDSRWGAVQVPAVGPASAAADFTVLPWSPGTTHPTEAAAYGERLREIGLNAEFAADPYLMSERAMPGAGYIGGMGMFRETRWSADGVRPRCLSDPAVRQEIRDQARTAAAAQKDHGPFAVGITDEAFLTSRHRRHEVCFGPHCQARYRKWLQELYGDLDTLNREWDSAYTGWEQVVGVRTDDIRGKENAAPFVDFRQFMAGVWIEACRDATVAYHEIAPQVPVGHTNTFGVDPFTGNDYWRFFTEVGFGWGQEYSEAIKGSAHKAIFNVWRSFCESPEARAARVRAGGIAGAPFFNYGWIGYDRRVAAARYEPWWLALHGARGVSWFAANALDTERGTSWALVHPSLSFTGYSEAARDALADLRGGCGKLLMEYERETPRVALLWSYPSMLVAWCESTADEPEPDERDGTDSYGTYFRSAFHIRQHLSELQLDYAYVAPAQILARDVLRDYPLLFLPFTVAASSALVDRLAAYVEAGGTLVGDLRCLRTDEHGKPVADALALQRLFGVTRRGAVTYAAGSVRGQGTMAGLDLAGRELAVYGREAVAPAGANVLAAHATGEPAVLVQPRGAGLAVYLNVSLSAYDRGTLDLLAQLVQRAGIPRPVRVESPLDGEPPRCYERNTFRRGAVAVHALIRDHRRCRDSDPVRVVFGAESHVYDVRGRAYLGHTARVEAVLPPGETALYACLPYRVGGLALEVPAAVEAGAELPLRAALAVSAGKPGDHVFHVELRDPTGRAVGHYARNLLAPDGTLTTTIPLALNETRGAWTVSVLDVLTGTSATAQTTIRPVTPPSP